MILQTLKTKTLPIPVAFSGLALATVGLAVLMQNFFISNIFNLVASFTAIALLSLVIIRNALNFSTFITELRHPVTGSFYSTFTMALMLLSNLLKPTLPNITFYIWIIGVVGHAWLLTLFILHRFDQKDFDQVVPSWVIPVVGLEMSVVAGKSFIDATWFYYIVYLEYALASSVLTLIIYSIFFKHSLKDAVMPTTGTLAAPFNLLLISTLTVYGNNASFVLSNFLIIAGISASIIVYISLIKLVQLQFSPLFASYTFPLILAATATLKYSNYLKSLGFAEYSFYHNLGLVQAGIGVLLYVLIFTRLVIFVALKIKNA